MHAEIPTKTADFDYNLPKELIAQQPVEPRDSSRLLVFDRKAGAVTHRRMRDLPDLLDAGDLLLFNDTRVLPARIFGRKQTGGKIELLLLKRLAARRWEALAGGRGLRVGSVITIDAVGVNLTATVAEERAGPKRIVEFSQPISALLPTIGQTPLPPYIHIPLADSDRYQTVYAQRDGSAAAPTAGLHFTQDLFARLAAAGLQRAFVTLHVGLDTFAPVTVAAIAEHPIHAEWREISAATAAEVNETRKAGRRVVAVGTTTVRALESAVQSGEMHAASGPTKLFITPGFKFQAVDALLTNFHLPRSTLLMLVAAFVGAGGRERLLEIYAEAIQEGYRFYSFGDAMLIL